MGKTAEYAKDGPLMMYGTEGQRDYLVIGRKGNVAIGIKPNAIAPGEKFGHPGTVWFGARLRSAPADDILASLAAKTKAG